MFGAGHLAGGVLAGEEPTLSVVRIAIGLMAGLAEEGDALGRTPAVHGVANDVTEYQELVVRMPNRPFDKIKSCGNLFELDICPNALSEASVTNLNIHSPFSAAPLAPSNFRGEVLCAIPG